ncbi:DUF3375 domain-containing protein [Algivirga pacifica]
MNYSTLSFYAEHNVTLRLLRSNNMPMVASFLFKAFKEAGELQLPESQAVELLANHLMDLNQGQEKPLFPKKEIDYLKDWTEASYLSHYYISYEQEPVYELTPAAERALQWLEGLEQKAFVGTESRLTMILDMLEELSTRNTENPQKRLALLEQQQAALQQEMEAIREGATLKMDETKVRERFFEVDDAIKRLLYDFKEVEANFKGLYETTREKIVNSQQAKGAVLDDIFEEHDFIYHSDQGKSFQAFWGLLMSHQKMEQLQHHIHEIVDLPALQELEDKLKPLMRFHRLLFRAGERVHKNNSLLFEQVKRYIEDQSLLENKRIGQLIREVEQQVLLSKENPPEEKAFFHLTMDKAMVNSAMERKLWQPKEVAKINADALLKPPKPVDVSNLFDPSAVDEEVLRHRIRQALQQVPQASLKEILSKYPVEKGLTEVLTYFQIGTTMTTATVLEAEKEEILVENKESGERYLIELPALIFNR